MRTSIAFRPAGLYGLCSEQPSATTSVQQPGIQHFTLPPAFPVEQVGRYEPFT